MDVKKAQQAASQLLQGLEGMTELVKELKPEVESRFSEEQLKEAYKQMEDMNLENTVADLKKKFEAMRNKAE